MPITEINPITEIFHFEHDDYCVISQTTNHEDLIEIVVDVKDIPKIIATLNDVVLASGA